MLCAIHAIKRAILFWREDSNYVIFYTTVFGYARSKIVFGNPYKHMLDGCLSKESPCESVEEIIKIDGKFASFLSQYGTAGLLARKWGVDKWSDGGQVFELKK